VAFYGDGLFVPWITGCTPTTGGARVVAPIREFATVDETGRVRAHRLP